MERRRSLLTATASVCDKRVTVTVNAEGVLIETRFGDDIGDLTYDEIAVAVPDAVRTAAREVTRKSRELMWGLLERDTETPVEFEMVDAGGERTTVALTPTSRDLPASLREPESDTDGEESAGPWGGAGYSVVREDDW
ncbi:YbaB/EbfC family DNA-binding protein [Nocardia arthritidis]|uniref:YbaB/EbfC family DNA-binding protein n=1 Tax=Nocardia arthritidis TaxID=228602 RepID=A0A6G9YAB0_9NOCA|nr:YbaB/EbfC family nucleoid-associated protein [Nocardia arthritidis]QIS10169.1 YbaB/EbfC family DNA-binding protein [Nocardia arthritidis]